MTIPTHILAGLVIGKITGSYAPALIGATIVDLDHFYSYAKSGVVLKPKLLWQTLTAKEDPYGDQRWIFHTAWMFLFIAILFSLFLPTIAFPFLLGYGSHLLLESLDASDYWPLYPYKKLNIKGPIKYYSVFELLFAIGLLVLFFLL